MLNFGIANVMTKAIGFFLIPVYTQYLTPQDYGIVEICASFSAFAIVFMRLGVPGSVLRFYFDYKDDESAFIDYITTIHRLLIASSIVIGLIMALLSVIFSESLLSGVLFVPFIALVLINSAFSANNDLQKRLLQSKEDTAYMAKLNIATASLGIGITILFVVVFEMGALGLILSQSVTTFLFFVQSQFYLRKYVSGKFRPKMIVSSLKYGVALLPHHLFAVLAPFLSKGILNYKESLAALGIYSLALRFMQPLDIIYDIFNKSFAPIYFSLRKNKEDQKIRSVYISVWYIAIFIFASAALILPTIIPLITPQRFHESSNLIPILTLGFMGQIAYMFFLQERFYDKKTKFVSIITGLGLAVNLTVTALTVNQFGVYSIAVAYSSGFITWAITAYLFSDKHFLNYISLKTIFFGVLIIIPIFLVATYTANDAYLIRTLALMALAALTLAFNYQRFRKVLSIVKK
jgi:O-antigen/teichoic acid export membrane protein